MTQHLHDELFEHRRTQAEIDAMLAAGITQGGLGVADVTFNADTFEFKGTTKAVIIPAYDGDQLVDLVAADAKKPTRFSRLERRAWCLGETFDAWEPAEPLPVWRTPLRWLREGCAGIVILDWAEAYWRLPDRTLIAEDEIHGRQIRASMQPPDWTGRVMVPRPSEAAA